jgi:hypothetical protein
MNNRISFSITTILKTLIIAAFVVSIPTMFGTTVAQVAQKDAKKHQSPPAASESPERFDYMVRADFFAGFAGDQAALERGMKACNDTLARNPNHAEALVWHGGGLVFIAGQAFQKGDVRKGTDLWDRGLNEMDRAVALEPNNVGVLIPRGATLLPASRFVPDKAVARALLEKAVGDYEKVLAIQTSYFARLSSHARGELLFGLGEGWARLGDTGKARVYFERIVRECNDSGRRPQAAAWLEKGTLAGTDAMSCTGCHTR